MIQDIYNKDEILLLSECTLCPRECRVNRFEEGTGYCGSDAGMNIASICIHRGEEPPISGPDGICNIFFSGCNLKCIYCQNHEISRKCSQEDRVSPDLNETLDTITGILNRGIKAVGFVSPSHVVPQVKAIIRGLNSRGMKPITVYNTNGYDKPEVIDSLDGLIDVYLPDYKYATPVISAEFSDASDYPMVALNSLKRMYYQKGSTLHFDEEGRAENGILIRHLVLPGHVEESKNVLGTLADELSTGINISLMSQYHPTPFVKYHTDLKRILYRSEYESVVSVMENLGFRNGWLQDMDSYQNYRPDFRKEHPFE
ncbi:MAG TPA: radical SAM protein [Bacteroidales bacterium]|nr:radical SAM protein [Bacteroidales bacterium]HBZ22738.1 radical SAM protein [Bacteroidales bacterium]